MKKVITASALALAAVFALTGCIPGAQNLDPAGKGAGASDSRSNPAQADKNACALASDATLAALGDASSEGPARVAWIAQGDGGWYVSAPLGATGTLSDTVGLWATEDDPSDTEFDGSLYALNDDAAESTSFSTAAPSAFSATSSAGKKALKCETDTAD